MRREPTTSQSLRERFSQEYEQLQHESDVVISCAQQFSWAGGYGQLFGGAGLMQKLPFRAHVGIKKTTTKRIDYVSTRAYTPMHHRFTDLPLSHFVDLQITSTFEQHILPLLPEEYRWSGYEIRLLIESDWLDVVPFFVGLAVGIMLLSGAAHPDFVRSSPASQPETIMLLWKLVCLLENGYLYTPSIAEVVLCLEEARMPVLVQTEDMSHMLSVDGRFVLHPQQLQQISNCCWLLYKYDEHFPQHQLMPLEWGIVSPGSHQMRSLHFPYTKSIPQFGAMEDLQNHMQQRGTPSNHPIHDPIWFRRKIELLHFYTMAAVDTFGRSLVTHDAGPFLHALHAMHEVSQLLQHHELDHVTAPGSGPFKEFLKKHLRGNYKYLITEKGLRGESKIFFAAPRHVLSGHMQTLAELYPTVGAAAFEYVSWIDGFGNEGVVIEYLRPFLIPGGAGGSMVTTGTLPPDVLVDCSRKKLFLSGHRVTSNDLRSQHFTVEILHILAHAPGHRVALTDLPRLSYTDSPSELHQKVLMPLMRAIKKHTGRDLVLRCEQREEKTWVCMDSHDIQLCFTHEKMPHLGCHKIAAIQQHLVAR